MTVRKWIACRVRTGGVRVWSGKGVARRFARQRRRLRCRAERGHGRRRGVAAQGDGRRRDRWGKASWLVKPLGRLWCALGRRYPGNLRKRIRSMALLGRHSRITTLFGLIALGAAPVLLAAAAEAATEVVTGVISCTSRAPRTATMNGTNGIVEGDLVCSSRPAEGDCTDQIRRDLDDRGCAFRRDKVEDERASLLRVLGPAAGHDRVDRPGMSAPKRLLRTARREQPRMR